MVDTTTALFPKTIPSNFAATTSNWKERERERQRERETEKESKREIVRGERAT